MELLIILIIAGLLGWLGYAMAESRNRDKTLWAVLCFLFGIVGIIVLALLGKAKE
jgi:uncharacterized membrane protein YeaQ/YmgE (transglycosylase-associated protein family)